MEGLYRQHIVQMNRKNGGVFGNNTNTNGNSSSPTDGFSTSGGKGLWG